MKAGALAEKAEAPPAPLAPKAPALKGGALAEKAAAADDVGGPELKAWLDELNAGAPALSAGALVNGAAAALKAVVEGSYAAGKVVGAVCHGPIGLILCGNQISDAPRYRRDVAPVTASARWRAWRNLTHWLISTQTTTTALHYI